MSEGDLNAAFEVLCCVGVLQTSGGAAGQPKRARKMEKCDLKVRALFVLLCHLQPLSLGLCVAAPASQPASQLSSLLSEVKLTVEPDEVSKACSDAIFQTLLLCKSA
jgi:hypothetical protein